MADNGINTYSGNGKLDVSTLEGWLWDAACKIRGAVDAAKYKDYILPIVFIKRLSDVFEDEVEKLSKRFNCSVEEAEAIVEGNHTLVRFYIPSEARWSRISSQTSAVGEYLTTAARAIARENDKLSGVVENVDFNATAGGSRIVSEEGLISLLRVLGKYRLGLDDVEPDILGRAYEYLLRKFAEGSGQSAGEFYTPREVALLMAYILDPKPGDEIYDPTCGSGGLLIKAHLRFKEKYDTKEAEPLRFFGQEINHDTFAMAKMNVFIQDMEAEIALGDTMNSPRFLTNGSSLRKFDKVSANPMWNQDFDQKVYENDAHGRFSYGYPPSSSADWGWIQHMSASLNEKGKMAVVLDTGAVSRGSGASGASRERDIRKRFVEEDLVEAVILMPENLFYNTSAPGIILVVNKNKGDRKDQVLLINASKIFEKGRPKNFFTNEGIEKIFNIYEEWKDEDGLSVVVDKAQLVKNDYNLSPSRYVASNDAEEVLPLEEAITLLKTAEEERAEADRKLKEVLGKLGFEI